MTGVRILARSGWSWRAGETLGRIPCQFEIDKEIRNQFRPISYGTDGWRAWFARDGNQALSRESFLFLGELRYNVANSVA